MTTDTLRLAVDASGAIKNLDRFEREVDGLLKTFNKLEKQGGGQFQRVVDNLKNLRAHNVSKVTSAMDKNARAHERIAKRAEKSAAATERAGRAITHTGRRAAAATRNLRGLENAFSATYHVGGLLRTVFSALTLRHFTQSVYDASLSVQRFNSLIGVAAEASGTTVAQHFQFASQVAEDLALDINVARKSYAKFSTAAILAGTSVADTQKIFSSFSGALRVMGASADDQGLVFLALEQMMSKGRVQSEELRRQLGERIPGAVQMMAESIGVSVAELGDLMKQGKVTQEAVIKMADTVNDKFEGQVASALERADSKLTLLRNSWQDLLVLVGESGFMDALGQAADRLATAFSRPEIQEAAISVGQGLGGAIKVASDALILLLENIKPVSVALGLLIAKLGLSQLASFASMLFSVSQHTDATGKAVRRLHGPLGLVVRVFRVLFGIFARLNPLLRIASLLIAGIGAAFSTTFVKTATEGASWQSTMAVIFEDVSTIAGGAATSIAEFFSDAWSDITAGAAGMLESIWNIVGPFFRKIHNLLKKIPGYSGATGAINSYIEDVNSRAKSRDARLLADQNRSARKLTSGYGLENPNGIGGGDGKAVGDQLAGGTGAILEDGVGGGGGGVDSAARALEQRRDAAESLLEQLFPLQAAQTELAENTRLLNFANEQGIISDAMKADAIERLTSSMEEQIDPYGTMIASMREELRLSKMTSEERDLEVAKRDMIQQMQRAGIELTQEEIRTWEKLYQAIKKTGEVEPGFQRWASNVDDFGTAIGKVEEQIADELVDALTDMAMTGEMSFEKLGNSILRMVTKVMMEQMVQKFIGIFMGGAGGGGGGGFMDLAGGLLGAAFGGFGGGGGGGASFSFSGGASSSGGFLAGVGRSGGLSTELLDRARAPISAFKHAPHFEQGGVTGGIPAVLHDNEAVVPLSRGREIPVKLQNQGGNDSNNNGPPIQAHFHFPNGDVDSFRRSQGQVEAMTARTLERAKQRNL